MNPTAPKFDQKHNQGWAPQFPMQQIGFQCPYCKSPAGSYVREKISTQGWVVVLILLLVCFPLFFIGLLMKEQSYYCRNCHMKLS